MNIALLGYGKMGQLIEKIAKKNGHTVLAIANSQKTVDSLNFKNVDVAIDFSTPDSAFKNISFVLNKSIPVVSGTTAWLEKLGDIHELTTKKNTAFLYASNFSIGVNLFFELNKKLNHLMNTFPEYNISIKEIHHTEKLDIPSGTALSLQSDISTSTPIISDRIKDVPGTHIINYTSSIDTISIAHEAHNRNGFAQGALLAAKWIINKKGCFSMRDVLEINLKNHE